MTTKNATKHDDDPKPKAADKKQDAPDQDDVRKLHQRIESEAGGKK